MSYAIRVYRFTQATGTFINLTVTYSGCLQHALHKTSYLIQSVMSGHNIERYQPKKCSNVHNQIKRNNSSHHTYYRFFYICHTTTKGFVLKDR